ncbi:winged helix-turn-helix domain-containing protein [Natronococcus roseus]|uniref:winged helix-turn-helix domain-containing protein n=1 Tax=Natronococcus roseus TaxID=1052014 RepID=UPI00374D8320
MAEKHLDVCLRIVSDRQRRRIVYRLREESNGKTTIEDLIDQLQSSSSASTDTRLDRDQLAIQLAHKHLPKLADHGIIEVDSETDIVRYQPDEQIEAVLDSLPEQVVQTNS